MANVCNTFEFIRIILDLYVKYFYEIISQDTNKIIELEISFAKFHYKYIIFQCFILLFFANMDILPTCMCVHHVHTIFLEARRQWMSDSQELELTMVVSHFVGTRNQT